MFQRLAGVETEYALRFRPRKSHARTIGNLELFQRIVERVRKKTPLAPAITQDLEWVFFTGNGGAVRFDRLPFLAWLPSAGVVEGATPECRGPRQLLRYQRAQDILLSSAAAASGGEDGEVSLVKNNRDGEGNSYGTHENYEATLASGVSLWLWRIGIAILLPLTFIPLFIAEILCWILLFAFYPVMFLFGGRTRRSWPFLDRILRRVVCLIYCPAVIGVEGLVRLLAFRRVRREMLAFLVSRPVVVGAGMVDEAGRFSLSARASVLKGVCSSNTAMGRAIFCLGHVWKGLQGLLAGDGITFRRLFAPRQRLQIACGDANVAQTAEYLKLGTTLLVLDAIEAGLLKDAPLLRSPLEALNAICTDVSLTVQVPLVDGRRWSALEIQRFYLDACRRYVAQARSSQPAAIQAEADLLLDVWQSTLDALEGDRSLLIGKLDWVTKHHLLEANEAVDTPSARRKIDLRYHELTRDGYAVRLEAAGISPTVLEPEEVLEAIDVPPVNTPAAKRGQLIRTHSRTAIPIWVSWNSVMVGTGKARRVIRLDRRDQGARSAGEGDPKG